MTNQVARSSSHLSKLWELETATLRSQILPLIHQDHSKRILDVGCGHGALVALLNDSGYANVTGIDRSQSQIAFARERGVTSVIEGDVFSYLRGHQSELDVVTAIDVVEHFQKQEVVDLFGLVRECLRGGGTFIIRTPNSSGPFGSKRRYDDFTHELSFTPTSISQVLRSTGFEVIKVVSCPPPITSKLSVARRTLWTGIETILKGYLAVETGVIKGHVLTQNLLAVARRPSE